LIRISKHFNNLRDKKVLITAGPTREHWDPVRFLTNASSGTMGIALALEAKTLGAQVTLILGPIPGPAPRARKNLRVVRVAGALDMEKAVQENLTGTQVFVGAAAVSDYRPETTSKDKIKDQEPAVTLRLVRNPDIIARVARRSPHRPPVVIGFALETRDLMDNAQDTLKRKGLDWIVANRETNLGTANGSAIMFSRWQERIPLGKMPKQKLAKQIWKALLARPAL
jgi:phosphopantothenoylcysteine decarboxylase / phosphopantothenate---cysteine ligase